MLTPCKAMVSEREAARGVLGPIYDSFTEGFDLEDLRVAKSLLDD